MALRQKEGVDAALRKVRRISLGMGFTCSMGL
jgi:hypothetical protein